MAVSITPLRQDFFAEVTGVDLRHPMDDPTFDAVLNAFERYAVLLFSGQPLDDNQQIAFSERFGPLERTLDTSLGKKPEIANLSNVDNAGKHFHGDDPRALFLAGNQRWHTDSSFKVVPAMASALSAREVPPEGGETDFADMRAAYDALPDAEKNELDGLVAEHDYIYSQGQISLEAMAESEKAALPPVRHRVIRTHPVTGRKSLYIGRHASHIVGRPIDESRALLAKLLDDATQPQFVHRHRWQVGDLVMWDNRCVLHRGRPWDEARYRRVMHRTTIAGEAADNPWLVDQAAAQ